MVVVDPAITSHAFGDVGFVAPVIVQAVPLVAVQLNGVHTGLLPMVAHPHAPQKNIASILARRKRTEDLTQLEQNSEDQ